MKRQSLFRGTVLLLISNIFVKGLGFAYRVVLVRLLTTEGVGLTEMVSPLFSFLLVLAGCGIQTALAQLIASGRGQAHAYFRSGLLMLAVSGSLVTGFAYLLAPLLVEYLVPDHRILLCFQSVLPAVMIISMASAFRGLFQGRRIISAIGMSQNVEQVVRVLTGLWLATRLLPLGLEHAASAVALATVAGEGVGFAYLLFTWGRLRRQEPPSPRQPWRQLRRPARELLSYGLPLTFGRLATSGIMMLQAFLIPICLQQAGWDMRAATEIYGRFAGVALSLLHLPGVFTAALSVSVLPTVAESMNLEHTGRRLLQKRITQSLYATIVFTLPGMLLLFTEAGSLCTLIFDNAPAAPILRVLTAGGCFLYLQVTLTGVLQGLGRVRELLANNIIAGLVMLAGIWLLTPQPALGILGAALAADLGWLTGFLLNLFSLLKAVRFGLPWKKLTLRPLLAGAAAGLTALILPGLNMLNPAIAMTASLQRMVVTAAIYFLVLGLSGGLKLRT